MVNAQDKALATLCIERGLLDDAAVERARLAHAELLERGEPPPLGNLLVQKGFLQPAIAAGLLRELALASFLCPRCERGWTYEELAQLTRYRCEGCAERLVRKSKSTRSTVAPRPDATEVDHGRPRTPSGRTATATGVRNTAISVNALQLPGNGSGAVATRPSATGRPSSTGPVPIRPSTVGHRSATGVLRPSATGPAPPGVPHQTASGLIAPTPPSGQTASPTARTLGPYEILSELGRGAMGVVYLGRRPGLERLFAIKVLLGGALADAEAVERFRREAALASRVQHPNVVPVYDVGVANGYYYYVMEHCPGRTLKQVLEQRGRFPSEEAATLVSKIARGVGAAHSLGVVHRDVKPANIMLEARSGNPRVADFGLARDASQGDTGVTRTGDLVGTPSYMAPEQLIGKKGVDARADVYALGVVLYELIAGVRPFLAETTAELAAKVLSEDARPLRSVVPDVPAGLNAIVSKSIDKDPLRRYANAGEVADDLDRFVAGEGVLARPEGTLGRTWRRSKRKILAGAAGFLVLGAVAGGVAWRISAKQRLADVDQARQRLAGLEREARLRMEHHELELAFQSLLGEAPESIRPEIQVAWASCLSRRGRLEAAFKSAQTLLASAGPEAVEAKRLVVDFLLATGNPTDAGPLVKGLESAPDAGVADWVRLRQLVADPKAASVPAEVRTRLGKTASAPSLRILAEIERRAGDTAAATEHLGQALKAADDDALAHLALGNLLRGSLDLARLRSDPDHDARKEVAAYFALAGPEAERNGLALYERARTAASEHRWSDVVRDLDAAIGCGYETPDADTLRSVFLDDRARACATRATAHGGTTDLADHLDVRDRIEIAAAVTPDVRKRLRARAQEADPGAREALETALVSSARGERFETALASFDEAAKASPKDPVVAVERARLLLSRGHCRDAVDAVRTARSQPGAASNDLLLIELEARWRQGFRADACEVAKQLAEADQEETPGLLARSFSARATLDYSTSIRYAQTAVSAAPESAIAHRFLALALIDGLRPDDGEAEAMIALKLDARLDLDNQFTRVYGAIVTAYLTFGDMGGGGGRRGERGRGEGWDHHGAQEARRLAATATFDAFVADFPIAFYLYERGYLICLMGLMRRADTNILKIPKEDFEKAFHLDPTSPLGPEGLGILCSIQDDEPGSAELFKKARALDPRWTPPGQIEVHEDGVRIRQSYFLYLASAMGRRMGGR